MIVLLWVSLARAACPEPASPAEVVALAQAAEAAFVALDPEGFDVAIESLEQRSGCLSAALAPPQAARLHTARALAAFLDEDEVRTIASLQAALGAESALELAEGIDRGHPIRMEVRLAEKLPRNAPLPLAPAEGERLLIDGHLQDAIVIEQPAVVQRLRAGVVLDSALVPMGGPLPAWAPLAPERISPELRRHLVLGGTTLATTAAAMTAWGAAFRSHQQFTDENTSYRQLDQYEARAARLSTLAIVAGAAATGSGLALVITW
ncbi:MAG: hypothetical protein ACI8S6_002143 [Myxococcota bacterium]|jgi:hypothetical protein